MNDFLGGDYEVDHLNVASPSHLSLHLTSSRRMSRLQSIKDDEHVLDSAHSEHGLPNIEQLHLDDRHTFLPTIDTFEVETNDDAELNYSGHDTDAASADTFVQKVEFGDNIGELLPKNDDYGQKRRKQGQYGPKPVVPILPDVGSSRDILDIVNKNKATSISSNVERNKKRSQLEGSSGDVIVVINPAESISPRAEKGDTLITIKPVDTVVGTAPVLPVLPDVGSTRNVLGPVRTKLEIRTQDKFDKSSSVSTSAREGKGGTFIAADTVDTAPILPILPDVGSSRNILGPVRTKREILTQDKFDKLSWVSDDDVREKASFKAGSPTAILGVMSKVTSMVEKEPAATTPQAIQKLQSASNVIVTIKPRNLPKAPTSPIEAKGGTVITIKADSDDNTVVDLAPQSTESYRAEGEENVLSPVRTKREIQKHDSDPLPPPPPPPQLGQKAKRNKQKKEKSTKDVSLAILPDVGSMRAPKRSSPVLERLTVPTQSSTKQSWQDPQAKEKRSGGFLASLKNKLSPPISPPGSRRNSHRDSTDLDLETDNPFAIALRSPGSPLNSLRGLVSHSRRSSKDFFVESTLDLQNRPRASVHLQPSDDVDMMPSPELVHLFNSASTIRSKRAVAAQDMPTDVSPFFVESKTATKQFRDEFDFSLSSGDDVDDDTHKVHLPFKIDLSPTVVALGADKKPTMLPLSQNTHLPVLPAVVDSSYEAHHHTQGLDQHYQHYHDQHRHDDSGHSPYLTKQRRVGQLDNPDQPGTQMHSPKRLLAKSVPVSPNQSVQSRGRRVKLLQAYNPQISPLGSPTLKAKTLRTLTHKDTHALSSTLHEGRTGHGFQESHSQIHTERPTPHSTHPLTYPHPDSHPIMRTQHVDLLALPTATAPSGHLRAPVFESANTLPSGAKLLLSGYTPNDVRKPGFSNPPPVSTKAKSRAKFLVSENTTKPKAVHKPGFSYSTPSKARTIKKTHHEHGKHSRTGSSVEAENNKKNNNPIEAEVGAFFKDSPLLALDDDVLHHDELANTSFQRADPETTQDEINIGEAAATTLPTGVGTKGVGASSVTAAFTPAEPKFAVRTGEKPKAPPVPFWPGAENLSFKTEADLGAPEIPKGAPPSSVAFIPLPFGGLSELQSLSHKPAPLLPPKANQPKAPPLPPKRASSQHSNVAPELENAQLATAKTRTSLLHKTKGLFTRKSKKQDSDETSEFVTPRDSQSTLPEKQAQHFGDVAQENFASPENGGLRVSAEWADDRDEMHIGTIFVSFFLYVFFSW